MAAFDPLLCTGSDLLPSLVGSSDSPSLWLWTLASASSFPLILFDHEVLPKPSSPSFLSCLPYSPIRWLCFSSPPHPPPSPAFPSPLSLSPPLAPPPLLSLAEDLMLFSWPCLLGTRSEVIRGTFRVPGEDVGLPSEVPSLLFLATPGGMVWTSGPRLRTVFFPGTTTCQTGRGGPVTAARYTPLTLGPVASPCLCPYGVATVQNPHSQSEKPTACIWHGATTCRRCASPPSRSC